MSEISMEAYYYSFTPTGNYQVDKILSAVAAAGHSFHSTEDWNETALAPGAFEGDTPVEWIQNAANDMAAMLEARKEAAAKRKKERE